MRDVRCETRANMLNAHLKFFDASTCSPVVSNWSGGAGIPAMRRRMKPSSYTLYECIVSARLARAASVHKFDTQLEAVSGALSCADRQANVRT